MGDPSETVRELAEQLAGAAGVDLLDVQVRGPAGRRLVRVVVDRRGGVDLETCQRLSRRLSSRLDEADPLDDRYTLEVTSPGVDHPLAGRDAFTRVEGRDVLVHRAVGDGRVLQLRGRVAAAEAESVTLDADGETIRVPYDDIVKATQSLPW